MAKRFENDNLKHAKRAYNRYSIMGFKPSSKNPDYGLYKYGEWLFKNE